MREKHSDNRGWFITKLVGLTTLFLVAASKLRGDTTLSVVLNEIEDPPFFPTNPADKNEPYNRNPYAQYEIFMPMVNPEIVACMKPYMGKLSDDELESKMNDCLIQKLYPVCGKPYEDKGLSLGEFFRLTQECITEKSSTGFGLFKATRNVGTAGENVAETPTPSIGNSLSN